MPAVKDYSVEEKLSSLVKLQKIDSKLDQIQILKGELPMEVSDLEDEIQGLTSRKNRIEEEINGITDFIEQKKNAIKEAAEMVEAAKAALSRDLPDGERGGAEQPLGVFDTGVDQILDRRAAEELAVEPHET